MTITVAGYLVLAVAAVGIELAARRPNARVPTLGACLTRVMRRRVGRVAVLLAWLWAGWHFFVR